MDRVCFACLHDRTKMDESLLAAHGGGIQNTPAQQHTHVSTRKLIWRLLHFEGGTSRARSDPLWLASRIVELSILAMILANVGMVLWASAISKPIPGYHVFIMFSLLFFTVEYALRLWACPESDRFAGPTGRLRYATTPLAIIDLIALIPFYLDFFIVVPQHHDGHQVIPIDRHHFRGAMTLQFLRLLMLLSFFRIADSPVRLLLEVVARKQRELCALLAVCSAFVLTAACLMFFIEHPYQPSTFSSVPAAAWWAIETVTSLGYGDMVPASTIGKIFSSFVSVCAVFLFAVPAGVVTSGFIEHELEARDHRKTVNLTQTAADNAGYRYGTFSQSVADSGWPCTDVVPNSACGKDSASHMSPPRDIGSMLEQLLRESREQRAQMDRVQQQLLQREALLQQLLVALNNQTCK